MLRDEMFPTSGPPTTVSRGEDASPSPPRQFNHDNSFDDVFGSAPGSPSSDSADVLLHQTHHGRPLQSEVSDIPRMRSEHSTAGYRDGLTAAKATTIQEGFDEGYGLGAVMGLRVGAVLGALHGIHAALSKAVGKTQADTLRAQTLLHQAKSDLSTESIFARQWWGEDGIWRYEVEGDAEEDAVKVTFAKVVDAHPLVRKWEDVINQETSRLRLDIQRLEDADVDRLDDGE